MLAADWNLEMVQSRRAFELLRPRDGRVDWKDIRVAQLDTGYTEHPAFGFRPGEKPWLLLEEGLNLFERASYPRDPLNYKGNPGHGSRVLSVLCGDHVWARGDKFASEVGVAPRLPVIPCRVVKSVVLGAPDHREAVAEGIRHAISKGCSVVSISLGFPFIPWGDNPMGKAVDEAYEKGIIVVSAGGQYTDPVCYPGKFNRTIGVGGVDWQRNTFNPYGHGKDKIDVWAPAVNVPRLDSLKRAGAVTEPPTEGEDPGAGDMIGIGGSKITHDGKPDWGEGTSFATAHVAAAAAMWLLQRSSDLSEVYEKNEPWLRVEAFKRLLRDTASGNPKRPPPGNGTGILDIFRLLQAELPPAETLEKAAQDKDNHHIAPSTAGAATAQD